ncbi:MAG: DUF5686 family protein [Paludibacter sp.]|nr:DUF5686 family protein [Paludibacter sp.]
MNIKKALPGILLIFIPFSCFAAETNSNETLKGVVVDAQNNEPIPHASISLTDYGYGTQTNEKGEFVLNTSKFTQAKSKAKVSCVGFKSVWVALAKNETGITIRLTPEEQALHEVTVNKQKYKNRNNPAVELIQKVIEHKKNNRKEALDYYEREKYEKVQFAINHVTPDFQKKKVFKHFQFVFENIDSLKSNGDKILPVYLTENISDIYYQKSPQKLKEIEKAHKAVSFAGFDNKGIENNIKYLYQDVDIYQNNISLVSNQFLSPIAGTAPAFYRYYIVDTIQSGADKVARMYFGARNKEDLLFQGYLYVLLDGSYAIKRIELTTSKDININFVKDIKIVQEFTKADNKNWMLASDQISMIFGLSKDGRGIFGQKIVSYSNTKLMQTTKGDSILNGPTMRMPEFTGQLSDEYLETHRHEQLSKSEAGTYVAMDSVQKVPVFKRVMDIASIFLFGYKDLGLFEIGPISTFYMYNPIEGSRLRFGGRTTNAFSKKLNLETYLAYGLNDERFKYYLGGTWSFTKRNLQEFPVKILKMSIQNETQLPGQQMQFLMEDNFLLSIKRGVNDKIFYNKTFKIEHLNELQNHFSYTLGYKYTRMAPGGTLAYNYTDYASGVNDVSSLHVSEFYLNLRYAPHESFYQGKTFRIPNYSRFPIFDLRYTAGSKLWGNDYNYQTLRFNIRKRFYFSVLGYSDAVFEAGKIFGKVPYPLLNIPQANQTYSYQIESYNMMNFLEFVTDQYTSLLIDHTFNGFFFNKIPLTKKLGLREMLTCKILYGNLTNANNPNLQPDLFRFPVQANGVPVTYTLDKTPYIEGSVGIGNIFKIFRIDLVRRFTYLNNPNVSAYGVRMRFRLDF